MRQYSSHMVSSVLTLITLVLVLHLSCQHDLHLSCEHDKQVGHNCIRRNMWCCADGRAPQAAQQARWTLTNRGYEELIVQNCCSTDVLLVR